MPSDAQYPRQRFTLIELLIVISLISVLVSILLPALSHAKAEAVRTNCINRQRNLGMAVEMYRDDYDGLYPVNYIWNGTVPGWTSSALFPNLVKPYLGLDNIGIYTTSSSNLLMCPANDYRYGPTLGYTGIRQSTYCPGSSIAVNYWNAVQYGYGLRYNSGNMPKRHAPKSPSVTVLSGEGRGNGCKLGYVTSGFSSMIYFHPGQKANLLIADGHVQPYQSGMSLAQAGLKWNK